MNFLEVERIIVGYVNYFKFMHRAKISYFKNKKLMEIEIRVRKNGVDKKLLHFYVGYIKDGIDITIKCHCDLILIEKLRNKQYIESKDENKLKIKSIDRLHLFFNTLEETEFFI